MAWDDTDNEEEYDEEEYNEEEYNEEEYKEEIELPLPPFDPMFEMEPIERIKGWDVINEVINTKEDKLYIEKPPKKKSIKKTPIIFDFQNLDVPGDKNGAKEMR